MKALTLWQPWASLVMIGAKPYEFRTWRAPRQYTQQRIVIHAAARPMKMRELHDIMSQLGAPDDGTYLSAEIARPFLERCNTALVCNRPLEFGCGLGTVMLGTPIKAVDMPGLTDEQRELCNPDIWAWPVSDPRPFPEPVPIRGERRFWEWPFNVDEARQQ